MSGEKLLVVRPESGHALRLTDELLEALVYRLLGVTPPSRLEKSLTSFGNVVSPTGGALLSLLRGKNNPTEVAKAMPQLLALARSILDHEPRLLEPELEVVSRDDRRLSEFKLLGDAQFTTNVVYALHPLRPNCYLRVADFHRYLLDEKRAEFVRLAGGLGARSIVVGEKHAGMTSSGGHVSAGVPTHHGVVDVGVKGGHAAAHSDAYSLSTEFETFEGDPAVPEDCCWLRTEPSWQAMVEGRTGRTSILNRRVHFTYASDFHVNAELTAKIEGLGLSCGGSFHKMESLDATCAIEFYPRRKVG